jgi:hypothetical protein
MTISGNYYIARFESSTNLRYPVTFESHGEFDVYRVNDVDRLLLTPNFHYWVDMGEQEGPLYPRCDVVLRAPVAAGAWIEILRKSPLTTTFSAQPLQPFPTEQFEYTLDAICMIQQELDEHACDCRGDDYSGIPEIED